MSLKIGLLKKFMPLASSAPSHAQKQNRAFKKEIVNRTFQKRVPLSSPAD
jgi:hypothetical protein